MVQAAANQRDDDRAVWMGCKRRAEAWARVSSLPSRYHVNAWDNTSRSGGTKVPVRSRQD
jgi:hypothetical protein